MHDNVSTQQPVSDLRRPKSLGYLSLIGSILLQRQMISLEESATLGNATLGKTFLACCKMMTREVKYGHSIRRILPTHLHDARIATLWATRTDAREAHV